MTISDLKRAMSNYRASAALPKSFHQMYVSKEHFKIAKYACTTEEKDFTFHKGKVFFQGIELITPNT